MLHICFLQQQWFNLSDPAVEEAPYDSMVIRQFVGIDRHTQAPLPDNIDSDAYFQVPPRLVRRVDGRPQSKSES
jgi:hypothetical protein